MSWQTLREEFNSLLAVRQADFQKLFVSVEHEISCVGIPAASIRLHFVRHDASGEPQFQWIIEVILKYLTHYCLCSEKRASIDPIDQNERYRAARRLFRDNETSGQAGEMLLYFFIEAVLGAPQILKKMLITKNPNDERKGSDGVHMRWNAAEEVLEVIFGEAKLWADFGSALAAGFQSMTVFHNSKTKALERSYFSSAFSALDNEMKARVISYTDGENIHKVQEVHACLIGYDWDAYASLDDSRRDSFVQRFQEHYLNWAEAKMKDKLEAQAAKFPHKNIRLEFFFLPFKDVAAFRIAFNKAL